MAPSRLMGDGIDGRDGRRCAGAITAITSTSGCNLFQPMATGELTSPPLHARLAAAALSPPSHPHSHTAQPVNFMPSFSDIQHPWMALAPILSISLPATQTAHGNLRGNRARPASQSVTSGRPLASRAPVRGWVGACQNCWRNAGRYSGFSFTNALSGSARGRGDGGC